jgi:hypothetical protein
MSNYNKNYNSLPMVNYTSVLTPAANEIYLPQTDLSDSLAFMMKNRTIIKFDFPVEIEKSDNEKSHTTACESFDFKGSVLNAGV